VKEFVFKHCIMLCVDMNVLFGFEGLYIYWSFYFSLMLLTKTTTIHCLDHN